MYYCGCVENENCIYGYGASTSNMLRIKLSLDKFCIASWILAYASQKILCTHLVLINNLTSLDYKSERTVRCSDSSFCCWAFDRILTPCFPCWRALKILRYGTFFRVCIEDLRIPKTLYRS
jgi:hypothetical protein